MRVISPIADFERGQWHALNRVLGLINIFDTKLVKKGDLYDQVMELRPERDLIGTRET